MFSRFRSTIAHTSEVHDGSVGRWQAVLTGEEAAIIRQETQDLWTQLDPDCSGTAAGYLARL